MEQNIIGLGFDTAAFNAEQQGIVKGLLEVYNLSKQIGETSIKPGSGGGFTELKAQSDALKQLVIEQEKLIAVQQKSVQVEQQSTAAIKENTQAVNQSSSSIDAQIKKLNDAKSALAANAVLQKELTKDVKAGKISADEYRQRMTQLTDTQLKYKSVVSSLSKELKDQARVTIGLLSPYELLSKKYNEAAKNAQNLAVQFGVNSTQAKAASLTAKGLADELLTIDQTIGKSQRNVGNYAGGIQKAFSGLRTLANILPGIGLSGIFLLGFEAIQKVIEAIGGLTNSLFGLNQQRELAAQINEQASQSAAKEATSLITLRAAIESTKVPMDTRLQAIKDLKKEFPKLFDGLTQEELLTGKVGDAYDKATQSILRKAMASAAAAEIEKIAAKKFEILQKAEEDRIKTIEDAAKAKDAITTRRGTSDAAGTQQVNTAASQRAGLILSYNVRAKAAQAEIDLENKKQQFLLKYIVEGAEDSIKIETEKEKKIKIIKDKFDYNKWYSEYIKKVLAGFRELDEQERIHYENENELNEQERQMREDALDRTLAAAKRMQEEETAAIETHKAIRLSNFDNELSRKEISQKQYNQKKAAEEKAALIATLEVTKKELEAEKAVATVRQQSVTLLQSKIDKINAEITSAKAKSSDSKPLESKEKEFYAQVEKDAFAAYSFVNDLVKGRYERELNYLQSLIDKNNDLKNTQIANINASTVSAQEKAAQIQILEAQTAAKNEEIQRKMKAEKRKELIYDRDTAVVEIAAQTAIAVMKVIAQGGLYSTGLAVATAAFGALQIAALLARPIPTYGEGTDNHPGGPMIVGEKLVNGRYQKELVTIPGEGSFITDRPMLLNAAAGAKVKPLTGDTLNETMYSAMMSYTVQAISDRSARELREIKIATIDGNRALLSAINKQKAPVTNIIVEAGWHAHISKSVVN